jgi:molybdopterin/thiamine biosynthesis adenylyltransferase
MGFGHIIIMDDDHVEFSNLNRQWFFWEQAERMVNKAIGTAENLKTILINTTEVEAYPYAFQRTIVEYPGALKGCNLIFCFVDNEDTRHDVSKYCLDHEIPVIFGAVSREAINGQTFVQKPGGACLACLRDRETFKQKVETNTEGGTRCVDPSAIYAQTALLGICLYAGLAILMDWTLSWNVYELMLDRESYAYILPKKPNCKGCGK